MRYTTIIDITELPQVYTSESARLVYLHMVLRSGYHDYDRDMAAVSLRQLSMETGVSLSAVRFALKKLEKWHLVRREGAAWRVTKFITEQPISKRAKTQRHQQQQDQAREREAAQEQRERQRELEREREARLKAEGKDSFMVWYEQQMELAKGGDIDAQKTVERHRALYELRAKKMKEGA